MDHGRGNLHLNFFDVSRARLNLLFEASFYDFVILWIKIFNNL